jgi:sulfatase modifying factor 1
MATFSGKKLSRVTLAFMTAGAVIVIASCQSRGTPPPEPTPAEGGFAGASGPPASTPRPTSPPPATVTATANAPPVATTCPTGMKEVVGNYCADVEHLCIEGWADISSPYKVYPGGAKGVTYCQKYKPGHALCIGATTAMRFCIDQYEYPNVKGELPRVLVSWLEADKLCKTQGKRLCNDNEWTLACEGPDRLPFGYGWNRDETVCNIKRKIPLPNRQLFSQPDSPEAQAELLRVDGRHPIGSHPQCVSPYGVYDMTANVDEWCRDVTTKGASMTREPFVSVFKGGHMMGNIRNRCRPATTAHGPEFYDFVQGFRCCAEAR